MKPKRKPTASTPTPAPLPLESKPEPFNDSPAQTDQDSLRVPSPSFLSSNPDSPNLIALGTSNPEDKPSSSWASRVPLNTHTHSNPPQNLLGSSPPGFAPLSSSPRLPYAQLSPYSNTNTTQKERDEFTQTQLRGRPQSMHAQHSYANSHANSFSPYSSSPPTRHARPATHYRSLSHREIGLVVPSDEERVTFESFDTLHTIGTNGIQKRRDVILLGKGGGFSVLTLQNGVVAPLTTLENVDGQVLRAKILPQCRRDGSQSELHPLAALLVERGWYEAQDEQDSEQPGLSLEIWSLKASAHSATLLHIPSSSLLNHLLPDGARPSFENQFQLSAERRFLTLTSIISGELWIFENTISSQSQSPSSSFRCLGKVWTTTQLRKPRSWSVSSAESEEPSRNEAAPFEAPIYALSARWLAYVPPPTASRTTLVATLDESLGPKPVSFDSVSAPSQPPVNTAVDAPLEESRLDRVTRDVAQEMLKGARWVGNQGLQAWNSYWKGPQPAKSGPTSPEIRPSFPPTHALENDARRGQCLVSIVDLERLSESLTSSKRQSFAASTFELPGGCSFASFDPSGLHLLTSNAKGDYQYIWNLMQLYSISIESDLVKESMHARLVTQVARFTRVTESRIVDVVWSWPHGERIAVVTDRGTVHLHDLPSSTTQWPQRKRRPPPPPPSKPIEQPGDVPNEYQPQPFLSTLRNLPGTMPSLSTLSKTVGVASTRLVASGLTTSMGAASDTVKSLRAIGETRVSLPKRLSLISPGLVRWTTYTDKSALALLGNASIRMNLIRLAKRPNARRKVSIVSERVVDTSLLKVSGRSPGTGNVFAEWMTSASTKTQRATATAGARAATPMSFAEIETAAPKRPVHLDKRISVVAVDSVPSGGASRWVFGEDLALEKAMTNVQTPVREVERIDFASVKTKKSSKSVDLSSAFGGDAESFEVHATRKVREKTAREPLDTAFDRLEPGETHDDLLIDIPSPPNEPPIPPPDLGADDPVQPKSDPFDDKDDWGLALKKPKKKAAKKKKDPWAEWLDEDKPDDKGKSVGDEKWM